MLHTLGVSMGKRFMPNSKNNQKGFFEAIGLRRDLARMVRSPLSENPVIGNDFDGRVNVLRQHVELRKGDSDPLGAKHPHLCLLVPEMAEAWPGVKVVTVTRDLDTVMESMKNSRMFPRANIDNWRAGLERMITTRDADAAKLNVPVLALNYADVLANPAKTVDDLIAFAGISPASEQKEAAVAFVDQELCHHPSTTETSA